MSAHELPDILMIRETLHVLDGALKAHAELRREVEGGVTITIKLTANAMQEVRFMSLDRFGSVIIEPLLLSAVGREE